MNKRFVKAIILVMAVAMLTACGEETTSSEKTQNVSGEQQPAGSDVASDKVQTSEQSEQEISSQKETEEPNATKEPGTTSESEQNSESDESNVPKESDTLSETPSESNEEENTPISVEIKNMQAKLYAKKTVNIRKEPSSSCEKVGALAKGECIDVTGLSDNGWYRVRYNGEEVFISASYLIEEADYLAMVAAENAENDESITEQPVASENPETPTSQQPQTPATGTTEPTTPVNTADFQTQVVNLINQKRSEAGLPAMEQTAALSAAAQVRAAELEQSFSHDRPNGTSCFTVLTDSQIAYMAAGENIAAGQQTPEEVMNAWMNSDGHRANILSASYAHVGIGIYYSQGGYGIYWVQLFTD